jgi:hypothetical protein
LRRDRTAISFDAWYPRAAEYSGYDKGWGCSSVSCTAA